MHIDEPFRIWFPETLSEYILEQNISYNTSLYHIYKSKPLYLCQKKKTQLQACPSIVSHENHKKWNPHNSRSSS